MNTRFTGIKNADELVMAINQMLEEEDGIFHLSPAELMDIEDLGIIPELVESNTWEETQDQVELWFDAQ